MHVTILLNSLDPNHPEESSGTSFETRLAQARPALLAYARRVAGTDGEDLCQDVCTRALRYQASFDSSKALLPWLRVCLMRERSEQLRRLAKLAREQGFASEPQAPAAASGRANDERVQALLDSLDPVDAMLLRGFHLEQRSINELALASGLAPGSVRSRLHRARQRLAEQPMNPDVSPWE